MMTALRTAGWRQAQGQRACPASVKSCSQQWAPTSNFLFLSDLQLWNCINLFFYHINLFILSLCHHPEALTQHGFLFKNKQTNRQKQRKSGLETQLNCKTCFPNDLSLVPSNHSDSSQTPATPAPWHPTLSSGLCRHLHSCSHTHTQNHTDTKKFKIKTS